MLKKFPDSLVVTPSPQMVKNYDRAIEKSLKMMEVYPRDKKLQDRAYFLMGKAAFYKKDYKQTISRMRDLQAQFPLSPLVPESYLFVAKAYIQDENLGLAEEILQTVLEKYPYLDDNQQVTLLLVEIAIRREGRSQAIGLLEKVRASSLSEEKRLGILLKMADLQFDLKQYSKSYALLRTAHRSNKYPVLMYRLDRSIYFCYDAMDSLSQALKHVDGMIKNRMYREYQDQILFYKGMTLSRLGRIDDAINIFIRIVGTDSLAIASDTTGLKGRAHYELAQLYRINRGDYQSAMAAYQAASKSRDSLIARPASRKMKALEMLFALRSDSTGAISSANRYSVGELFQFDLEMPDSALNQFLILCNDTSADSAIRPRALSMAAFIVRSDLKDTTRSDSLLKIVLNDYAGTEFARKAQEMMELPITVVTRQQEAEAKFREAENLYYKENNPVEAIKVYYDVAREYADLDLAPKSLYAAAWHTDNDLQKNRVAMKLYQELCDTYANSEYCIKYAQPRLSIAKDTIEARRIRREKAQAVMNGTTPGQSSDQKNQAAPVQTGVPVNQGGSDALSESGEDDLEVEMDNSETVPPSGQSPAPATPEQ